MAQRGRKNRAALEIMLEDVAKEYMAYTHFNYVECLALVKMHEYLSANEAIDRMRFRSILYSALEITDSFMLDRIYRVADTNDDGIIDSKEWILVLSVLLRGTLDEMIEFCYTVYDINGDRALTRDELHMCFENCFRPRGDFHADEIEDAMHDLIQLALNKLDVDKDGIITFSDFKAAVENDPLLLQTCGVCLPPNSVIKGFQYIFTWDYNNFYNIYQDNARQYNRKHHTRKAHSTSRGPRPDHLHDFTAHAV